MCGRYGLKITDNGFHDLNIVKMGDGLWLIVDGAMISCFGHFKPKLNF